MATNYVKMGIISSETYIPMDIIPNDPIPMDITTNIIVRDGSVEYYDGPTEVTPSEDTQVLLTNDLMMQANVTINPIPENYGRITWNGSVLTVY